MGRSSEEKVVSGQMLDGLTANILKELPHKI